MTQPSLPAINARTHPAKSSFNSELALTLLGPSSAMTQLWSQIRRVAPYVRTVLLTGEADCGQEAVARLFLDLSRQSHRSFIELSAADAEGRLLRAAGLTAFPTEVFLFLPDVHRLSREAQEGILHLLKTRRARPFTVVAASTEDLRAAVSTGKFSAELAEALGGIQIALPPLGKRVEDIPMLLTQLLSTHAETQGVPCPRLTEDFLRAAMTHTWAGNLRELADVVDRLLTCASTDALQACDLHQALAQTRRAAPLQNSDAARMVSLDTVMREHITAVLRACQGNKLRAAETLGISRSTLYRMLDYGTPSPRLPLTLAS